MCMLLLSVRAQECACYGMGGDCIDESLYNGLCNVDTINTVLLVGFTAAATVALGLDHWMYKNVEF